MIKNNLIKITLASMIATLGISSAFAQGNVNNTLDTTAKIENFCSLNAGEINFGVVNLPLTAQSANSSMNVLCTKNTSYKIDLAYGGKYGGGATVPKESITYKNFKLTSNSHSIKLYIDGNQLSNRGYDIDCWTGIPGQVNISPEFAKIYVEAIKTSYYSDPRKICTSAGMVNFTNVQNMSFSTPSYNYGVMTGTLKGDTLAYAIYLPNDSTKVWNVGINSFNEIGTGSYQSFNLNAKIVPVSSSSLYVAADTYLDTVVANITY